MWLISVFLVFTFANYDTDHQLTKEKATQTARPCEGSLVQAPQWDLGALQSEAPGDCQDPIVPSLKGRALHQKDHGHDRQLPMALCLWPPHWQAPHALPCLQRALERWDSPQQRAKKSSGVSEQHRVQHRLGLDEQSAESHQEGQEEPALEERECSEIGKGQGKELQRSRGNAALTFCAASAISHPSLAHSRSNYGAATSAHCASSQRCPPCRTSFGCQEALSGPFAGTGRHPESSRQIRKSHYEGFDIRFEQGLQTSWKSCQTAFNSQGCSSSSQAELVEASPRLSCELAEATTVVQRPAEGVWRATHQSAAGAQLGQAAFAASEQAGSRDRCPGVNRNRRGDGQSCRSRQLPQLRSRSSCASATSPRKSRAKHCRSLSRQACRSHVGRGRGRCRQKAQTASIHGTIRRWTTTWIWWAHIITQAVNLGSEDLCLRNELHEPLMKQKATEEADAYCHNYCCDAACHPDLRTLIRCHSIHWDPNFLSEPVALGRATLLRNEVLSFVNPATNARSPLEPKANLKSCFKSSNWMQRKPRVTFLPFCEVIDNFYPPRLQPHGDEGLQDSKVSDFNDEFSDDFSFMARRPRLIQPTSDSSEVDSDFDDHAPTSPSSFPEHHAWQSAHVYDLQIKLWAWTNPYQSS